MAPRLQNPLGVDADAGLDKCALWHPLVVHPRRCHGRSNVHIKHHCVEQGLQHRGDDQGASRTASGQPGLAVFENNRGSHGRQRAPIGRDGIGFALHQSIGVGGTRFSSKIVHLVIQQDASAGHDDVGAEAEVQGVGIGNDIALSIGH